MVTTNAILTTTLANTYSTTTNNSSSNQSFQSLLDNDIEQIASQNKKFNTLSAPTTNVSIGANLNANQSIFPASDYSASDPSKNMASGAVTPDFTRNVTVFDSNGNPHTFTMGFLKTGANEWSVEVYASPASDVTAPNGQIASGTVRFNDNGTFKSASHSLTDPKTIHWTGDTKSSHITFDLGTHNKTDGLTQYASSYNVTSVNQDGAPLGKLTGADVNKLNQIVLTYSNGLTKNIALSQLL